MTGSEFGVTAWGMDWVRLAEPLRTTRPEPLLPRARSVARNGGVHATSQGRVIRATVHRGDLASVTHLEVRALPRATATALTAAIPDPSVLTDEIHRRLCASGLSPTPVLAAADCSCPARSERCLHVLAVLYDTARRVDGDPRLALDLLGYFDAVAAEDPVDTAPPPRWTPLHLLDPADYFDRVTSS